MFEDELLKIHLQIHNKNESICMAIARLLLDQIVHLWKELNGAPFTTIKIS
jgi:hypothetical protein